MRSRHLGQLTTIIALLSCGLLLSPNSGRDIVVGGDFLPKSTLLIRTVAFSINQNYLNLSLILSYFCVTTICVLILIGIRHQYHSNNNVNFVVATFLIVTALCAFQVQEEQKLQGGFPLTRDYNDDLTSIVENNDEGEKLTRRWLGVLQIKQLVGDHELHSSNSFLNNELTGIGRLNIVDVTDLSSGDRCEKGENGYNLLGYFESRRILYKTPSSSPEKFSLFLCGSEILIQ